MSKKILYRFIGAVCGCILAIASFAITDQTTFDLPMYVMVPLFPDGLFYELGGSRVMDAACKLGSGDYSNIYASCLRATTFSIHLLTWMLIGFAIGWFIGYRSERKQHVRI